MNSIDWLNPYYRTIISSFNINNTHKQNVLLLNELNELNPDLIQEAYDLIQKGKIIKYQYLSDKTNQSFYITETDKTYFTIKGFKYRDNLLIKENDITCIHEIILIILEYIIPFLNQNNPIILHKTVYLNESEFIEKIKSLIVF